MPFEVCPKIKVMCAYCGKDEKKELRCGIGETRKKVHYNLVKDMKKCPKGD